MTLDEIVDLVSGGTRMTWGEWDAATPRRPGGVWVDLGDGEHPNIIPGTRKGPNGIQLLPDSGGKQVPALTTKQREELDL
ncbi:MAG: hypothetical protein WBE26_04735 [Phycisphaerae bacterium]